jgi:hypothetical protein
MDSDKFWVIIWGMIIGSITAIFITLMVTNHLNEKQFIQAGYSRQSLPGMSQTQWVKP